MSKLDEFRPAARISEPRFWGKLTAEPWFRVLRQQRVLSAMRLQEELAQKASELRAEPHDVMRVVDAYRREHGLTPEQVRQRRTPYAARMNAGATGWD